MRCSTSLQGCSQASVTRLSEPTYGSIPDVVRPRPAFGCEPSRSSSPPPMGVSSLLYAPGDISILRRQVFDRRRRTACRCVCRCRHLGHCWRTAQFRHPCWSRDLELSAGPARGDRAGNRDRRDLRQPPGAASRCGASVPTGSSGGCRDHPGSAECRGVPDKPRSAAPPDTGSIVDGFAPGRAPSSKCSGSQPDARGVANQLRPRMLLVPRVARLLAARPREDGNRLRDPVEPVQAHHRRVLAEREACPL